MHALISTLIAKGPVVTDGAWGTEIQKRGLKTGENPESWNLSHPELVEEVPKLYVDAGSQIILTNTFGANKFIQEKYGLGDQIAALNKAGVEISKRAAGDKTCVFASIGPSGKMLLLEEVSEADLQRAFEEQAGAISEAGVDGIVIETMTDINEALIAINVAKQTGLPVVASMVFGAGKDKDRTMMGATPEEVVEKFTEAGVDIIGANCGQGIEDFIPVCRRMKSITNLPLWMKPNAGLPEVVDGKTVYNTTAQDFAEAVPKLVEAGACFIGGCCGTGPEFIKKIAETVGKL
ncbi:MAG: homocysteine S-methyltransferase family protein [Deltaproteobacteria bacterium]|nr:homocysteine S-methyltransferase family protein [Deltaproteobacteria bacterium]MBW2595111.1 homocysteine S-methyltransferase family protein [Deltaproteobacteria bacterium]MBW2649471.1 homocysteine S-methyltransferase family protein [Deltaproteobacteria bacterium]